MISFWHLTAVCCVPQLNPERRIREQEIFRQAASDAARRQVRPNGARARGRWDVRHYELAGKAH
ncbi:MAG: hypothetical protein WDO13_02515 [Verrucomicrobiota bacterium]